MSKIVNDAGPSPFYYQWGQWLQLGLVIGVTDRFHDKNWIWCPSSLQLQMVDFENSFSMSADISQYNFIFGIYADEVGLVRKQQNAIKTGILDMHTKMVEKCQNMTQITNKYKKNWPWEDRISLFGPGNPDIASLLHLLN